MTDLAPTLRTTICDPLQPAESFCLYTSKPHPTGRLPDAIPNEKLSVLY